MSETAPTHPATMLMNLIITLLTPMFLAAAGNDLAIARQAAIETLNAYRAETQTDLITVAKIIGFGLAALGAISLSMTEDLPISTILRLHASANASDRAEHRNRQVLASRAAIRRQAPEPAQAAEPDIDMAGLTAAAEEMQRRTAENLASFTTSTPPEGDRRNQAIWAASAAAETTAALPTLSPEDRKSAVIWIKALDNFAQDVNEPVVPLVRALSDTAASSA